MFVVMFEIVVMLCLFLVYGLGFKGVFVVLVWYIVVWYLLLIGWVICLCCFFGIGNF